MVNLNKIFPHLSIRNKLLIAFGGLSILPMAVIGVYGILSNIQTMKNAALEELTENVQAIREKTSNFFEVISSDMQLMRNSTSLGKWIRSGAALSSSHDANIQQLGKELLALAETKNIYYQLRLIDRTGDEQLRIECVNPNDSAKVYRIVPARELRQSSEAYYFLLVKNQRFKKISFAPAELIDKKNERVSVMSFAMPLAGKQGLAGILIADVFEKEFIRVIESKRQFDLSRKVMLATAEGFFLYHSEKKKDWNRLLASREEDNLHRDYPPQIVDSILSGNEGTFTKGANDIISYAPLFSRTAVSENEAVAPAFSAPIFVIESVPESVIMRRVRYFAFIFIGFLVLFLVSALALGVVATRQFTRPIGQLEAGAEVIAHGSYAHRIHVETRDEIGKLADQFNVMAVALESHEKEIQRHQTTLEGIVRRRTHELVEEKTKLQALLDNVPSAFILLDKDFRIQTVSAAFEGLTGFGLSEVKEKDCGVLFHNGKACAECLCRKAVEKGTIESCIEEVVGKNQSMRFLERIAIPMRENGKITSVLQIITDVTKRKRFEQELVHAEKLTAAGEMSSIIAHEFRNSLTSIKMILQLLRESKRAGATEKKSLDVALDSIRHMDEIVIELLDFARPKSIQTSTVKLNDVVNDGLAFVKAHVKENRIAMSKKLDAALGAQKLDSSQIKEAVINILLNAIQSMNGSAKQKHSGKISVVTKKIKLAETLRELVFSSEFEEPAGHQPEIVLEKGTACALVEVSDTGSGIDKDQLHRIFDPFYTTKNNGTGLGLPMVKRTVNAHGGVMTVNSTKGKGATFRIYLPLRYDS
ncbi:MAG: PAS domain S-box protein [Bacteroidota bacterium]|nr:PAS domain S-box protein [Bacteroidota bacterium]